VKVAEGADGSKLFHVMASNQYPAPPRDEGCFGWTALNTWAREALGRMSVVGSALDIDNCDGKSVTSDTPKLCLSLMRGPSSSSIA
jgi:hypothetical protein